MSRRLLAPLVAAFVLIAAALLAAFGDGYEHPSSAAVSDRFPSAPAEPQTTEDDPASEGPSEDDLPPDHPPIDPADMPSAEDAPAVQWTAPADWKEAPNPNTFRLATYRTPGGAEVSVARAGGSTSENIARWASQFVDAGAPRTQAKTVHGLRVTIVEIAGMYDTASMSMGGGADEPGALVDEALVAAIVPASGSAYFFKVLGPKKAVAAARPSFDRLVASITPR